MTAVFIVCALVGLTLIWGVLAFNGLVRAHNRVDEAWSGVDVQLKRRCDPVPNLVAAVRGYAQHVREARLLQGRSRRRPGHSGGGSRMSLPPDDAIATRGRHLYVEDHLEDGGHLQWLLESTRELVERFDACDADSAAAA